MENITQLRSTILMIFQTDDISLSSLVRIEAFNHLNRLFKLQLVQQVDPFLTTQFKFRSGEFLYEDEIYLIDEISIDARRLIIRMNAPTEILDIFFNIFREELKKLDVRKSKVELIPQIITFETNCVCKLNFDLIMFFGGKKVGPLFDNIKSKIPAYDAKLSFIPGSIKFKIDYFSLPAKTRKNNITLTEKSLTIEYRDNTNPEERIYYSSSPTRSETHLEILNELESYYAN